MKLGVITDGISRDLNYALDVMNEVGLEHAELQFIGDKEVGDLSDAELAKVQELIKSHNVKVPCITRHVFGGVPLMEVDTTSSRYLEHIEGLRRCIDMANALGSPLTRVMSFKKEMILFGSNGADQWNVSKGAWDHLLKMMELPVKIAEEEGITLVVETGNNAMITSAYLARKLIDAMGSDRLKLLWDPCNSLYCNEKAFPDGYNAVNDGKIAHIHIKDSLIDIPKASVICTELNQGDMSVYLSDLAIALRSDNFDGVISLESVYRPEGGTFEEGFRASVPVLKQIFG